MAQLQLAPIALDWSAQGVFAELEAVAADGDLLRPPCAVDDDLAAIEGNQPPVLGEGQAVGRVRADGRDDHWGEGVVGDVGVDVPRGNEGWKAVVRALLVRVRDIGQTAHGVVALVPVQSLCLVIGGGGHDVGATVVEVPSDGHRAVVGVRAVGRAVLGLGGDAVEVLLGDEVDHPGHGVGAIDGRRPARHRIDARDRGLGDGVDVHRAGAARPRHMASSVHQHQGAAGAQVAQVQRRQPLSGHRIGGAGGRCAEADLRLARHGVDQVGDADVLDLLGVDDVDRSRGLDVRASDTRAGHHDIGDGAGFRLGGRRFGLSPGRLGGGCDGQTGDYRPGLQVRRQSHRITPRFLI